MAREVFGFRLLKIIVPILLILSIFHIPIMPTQGAPSEVIGVNLIVNNFLNDSDAKALSWIVFNGSKSPPSQVDNVVFKWYAPNGSLVYTDVIDPDKEAVAWSYFHVDMLGEWSVNVSYEGNASIWNNKSFDSLADHWGPGILYLTRTTLVSHNSTLTIEPGTTILFDEGKGFGVEGLLIARGNETHPIIFTSNLTTKTPGDWSSFTFFASSNDSSVLDHVRIEYSREGLNLMEASPLVVNCTFYNNRERAIYAELANTTIKNNHIYNDDDSISPIGILSAKSNLTIEGNLLQNMTTGLYLLNSIGTYNVSVNATINVTVIETIVMRDNRIENCESYGMKIVNSFVSSENDVFIGNRKGVVIDSESNTTFENLKIIGGLEGFTATDKSKATIWNSTIEDVEIATFILSGDSTVILINSSFSTSDSNPGVSIGLTDSSRLIIKNFLTIEVISFDNWTHLENATVEVYDGTALAYLISTDENGLTPQLIVTDRIYRPTLVENLTRVHVSWWNLSFAENNRSVPMSTSHKEVFLGSIYEFTDITPPIVISHYPTAPNVPLNIMILIAFNEPMENQSVEQAFSIAPSVSGTFAWSGNTLIFIPAGLANNTLYTVTIGTGAKDLANNSLQFQYQFSFTTTDITDTIPPLVASVFPTGNDVPIDISYISITFNEEMQTYTTEPAFSMEPRVPGILNWQGNTLRFHPVFDLSELTIYTITLNSSKASDIAGNKLDGDGDGTAEGSPSDDYTWSFTTRQYDFTPPVVTDIYPTGNMVDTHTQIRIHFSEAMNLTSVKEAFSYWNATVTWALENGTWGKSVYIITFIPYEDFEFYQPITVYLKGTAKDLLGNTLDGNGDGIGEGSPTDDFTWKFQTIYDPLIGLPTINEVTPVGANVGEGADISINFSQAMDQDSVAKAFTMTDGISTWSGSDGTFAWTDNRTSFIPGFTLMPDTIYTVRVNVSANNTVGYRLDGNWNLIPEDYTLDSYEWSYMTDRPELTFSDVTVDSQDANDGSKIWYADADDIVTMGVNTSNIGNFSTGLDFNVTLYNVSGTGELITISYAPLSVDQDSGAHFFSWLAPTAIGDHYVEIVIDPDGKIPELDENNNSFIIHFVVGPDYIPANITVNGMDASDPDGIYYVNYGEPILIGVEVKNIGLSGVSSGITHSITFWNSTSSGSTTSPVPFGYVTGLPGLGSGESSGAQIGSWFVPNEVKHFYVTMIIDYDETTEELDEGNNFFILHLAFFPDYAVTNVLVDGKDANDPKAAWEATAGSPVSIVVNATNLGLSGVSDSVEYGISFYNSTRRGAPLDVAFSTTTLSGLSSGEDSGEVMGLWLPPNSAGEHYVTVLIDSGDSVSEKNEDNNLFVLYFKIGPDIIPTSVLVNGAGISSSPSAPIYVGPGETVSIELNATNLGFSGTGSDIYLGIYNGTRDAKMSEQPYFNVSVLALEPFGSPGYDSGAISAFWTASLDEGLHYLVIYMDISLTCDESDERNNYWILTFVVSPDLVPDNISVDGLPVSSYQNEIVELLPGQSIVIGARTSNIGDTSTGIMQFSMAYYKSTSFGMNLEPSFAFWSSLGPLDKNAFTGDVYGLWQAPYPNKPTDYYINISVDSNFEISEKVEGNNFYILHVRVNAPDLSPDRIIIEGAGGGIYYAYEDPFAVGFVSEEISISRGMDITITLDVINIGGLNQTVGTDVTFYNTSSLLGSQNATPFYVTSSSWIMLDGSSYPASDQTSELGQTAIVLWPNPDAYGIWYINITIDFGDNIVEFNEYNNTFTIILNITDYPITSLKTSSPSYSGLALYVSTATELNFTVIGENPPIYTQYRIMNMTNGSEAKGWTNYTEEGTNFTMSWGKGTFKIEYYSTDGVGKVEFIRSRIVIVEESRPETNQSVGVPKYRSTASDVFNITSSTPLFLSAADLPLGESVAGLGIKNASGIKTIQYRIQNVSTGSNITGWTLVSGGVPFYMNPAWGDGYYIIWYNSTDNLGNSELMKGMYIYLDNSAPETSIIIGTPNWTAGPADRVNVSFSTQFTIQSLELVGSMADTINISFKITSTDLGLSSGWLAGSVFSIGSEFYLGDGNYTIEYRSNDNLGNMEIAGQLLVYADDTDPSILLILKEPKYREFSTDYYNVSDSIQINITALDTGSGLAGVEYRIINASYNSGWISYSGEFNLSGLNDDLYELKYRATDNLGNSVIRSINIYLDSKAPTTSLTMGEPKFRGQAQDQWNITSATTLELLYDDGFGSGMNLTEYHIYNSTYDSGWLPYTDAFSLSELLNDGVYIIEFSSIDNLGNMESAGAVSLRLDNSPPQAYPSMIGTAYREGTNDRWNVTSSTIFMINADDGEGSGVESVKYRIFGDDAGIYYSGWLPVGIFNLDLYDGYYTIEFYTVDNLTNTGEIGYLYLYLDNTPPESSISVGEPKYRLWPSYDWTVSGVTTFTLQGNDALGSGLEGIYYSIWNDTYAEMISSVKYTGAFNLFGLGGDGQYKIMYWAADNVNNIGDWNEWTVILDATSPWVSFAAPTGSGNSIYAYIKVVFSEDVAHESVEQSFSYTDGTNTWDQAHGDFTWSDNTMIFHPYEYLSYGAQYSVTINTAASDKVDNGLDGDGDGIFEGEDDVFTWYFWTNAEPDYDPPYVVNVFPYINAQNIELGATITIEFSEIMNELSVEEAFSYTDGERIFNSDDGILTWNGNITTFTPLESLGYNTEYTVTILNQVSDISGNAMSNGFTWKFTTKTDTAPPNIIAHSPSGDDVAIGTQITLTFNEPMMKRSAEDSFLVVPFEIGSYSWMENTLIFTPEKDLEYGTNYFVNMEIGAKDKYGNALASPYQFSFTTEADIYPPQVTGHSPIGEEVELNITITITFSESMQQGSEEDFFAISPIVQGEFHWEGNMLVFTPSGLKNSTTYLITVGTGAMDMAGNALQTQYQFSFTTRRDPYPPQVIDVGPTGENIPVDTVIVVTFNESMDISSVYSAFRINPYVPGSFSWEGNSLLFTPNGNLAENTRYTITIGKNIKDESGNTLAEDYSWEFETGASKTTSGTHPPIDLYIFLVIFIFVAILFIWMFIVFLLGRQRRKSYLKKAH